MSIENKFQFLGPRNLTEFIIGAPSKKVMCFAMSLSMVSELEDTYTPLRFTASDGRVIVLAQVFGITIHQKADHSLDFFGALKDGSHVFGHFDYQISKGYIRPVAIKWADFAGPIKGSMIFSFECPKSDIFTALAYNADDLFPHRLLVCSKQKINSIKLLSLGYTSLNPKEQHILTFTGLIGSRKVKGELDLVCHAGFCVSA